jgi:fatty acid desaturase
MAPNAKQPDFHSNEFLDLIHVQNALSTASQQETQEISRFLDAKSDTSGLKNISDDGEDWTDVKHSERKKRDRILDDGILLILMKKSDYQGFKRLFTNLGIMAATAYCIHRLQVFPFNANTFNVETMAVFIPLYAFYGFQFQCFAFAGQHEFLHRNAFKTKWINDWVLFLVGCVCCEFGKHERVMHKQHHTFTNNIDKDPELTSYYSREQLENPAFRNVPESRWSYFKEFWDVWSTFNARLFRVINSARGIAVDYSGTSWHMANWTYGTESGIMDDLKKTARLQLLVWFTIFATVGQTKEGLVSLFFWWIVPVLVGYPFVNLIRNLEHSDCEVSKESNNLRNTRTCKSNLLVRILLWDTNYHAEHHCYPMVPFFNLHKLHDLLEGHVIHGEHHHLISQNWECVKQGGWIDQQAANMAKTE